MILPHDITYHSIIGCRYAGTLIYPYSRSCFYTYCQGVLNDVCISCGYEHPPQAVYRGVCQKELYSGSLDAVFKISRNEGIAALWNGLTPTLFMLVPSCITYFTIYDYLRRQGRQKLAEKYHEFIPSAAGLTARAINVGLFSPIELTRTKAQSENKLDYAKLKAAVRIHIKANGISSLWDGAKPQLFRDVPFTVVYWYIQDKIRTVISNKNYGTVCSNTGGAFVGASIATVISHPFDVAKTQQQSNVGSSTKLPNERLFSYLVKIGKEQGMEGLFVGLLPRMAKLLPSCALMITSYEVLKEYFEGKGDDNLYDTK